MKHLIRLYEAWVERYCYGEPLVAEADNLDYIQDLMHRLDVLDGFEALVTMPA